MEKNNLNQAEECFREARITGELSNSSIEKYKDSLKKFFSVIGEKGFGQLEKNDFDDCILRMRDAGAGNSRIANVISAVKWVVKRLQDEGRIEKGLDLEKVRKPKVERREVEYLTEEEISMFLGVIQAEIEKDIKARNTRMMALVRFLLQTGARIGEALSIDIDDIDWRNKEVRIIGKGAKPRTLFLTDDTIFWLYVSFSQRKDHNKALFVALNGESRWQQTDVGRSFRRYRKLSGIKKDFTIHTLRHTFATTYLMKGAGINVVQTALGHTDAVTTLKYYAGVVSKSKVREMIQDRYFDFIPESAVNVGKRDQRKPLEG